MKWKWIRQVLSQATKIPLQVVEKERQQIARDFIEGPLQQLADLIMVLDRHITDSQRSRQPEAQEIGKKLAELHRDSLAIFRALHDCLYHVPALEMDTLDLRVVLQQDIEFLRHRTGLEIELETRGHYRPCPAEQVTALYRIMHEALVNVHKHAQARHVWVQLEFQDAEVRLNIRDDGCGFDPATGFRKERYMGLKTMKERASLAGGQLTVESRRGRGTSVQVCLPLPTAPTVVPMKPGAGVGYLSKALETKQLPA